MIKTNIKNLWYNLKKLIKDNDVAIVIAFFVLAVMGSGLVENVKATDETWNFQNAMKMYNGGGIYTDGNCMVTPLFYYTAMPFLKLFGGNLIAFRVYNMFILGTLFGLIYYLFRTLKVQRINAFLYTLAMPFMLLISIVTGGANYNIFVLIFVILGIILLIKKTEATKHKLLFEILHGICIFLIFFSKQNIGAFYIIAIIVIEFLINKNFKKAFFTLARQGIVTAVCLIIGVIILALRGQLEGLISYGFLALNEFGSNNKAINLSFGSLQLILTYTAILIWSVSAYLLTIKNNDTVTSSVKNNIIILLIASIAMFGFIIPIGNTYHYRVAFVVTSILLLYFLDIMIIRVFFTNKKIIAIFTTVFALFVLAYSSGLLFKWASSEREQTIEPYTNLIMQDGLHDSIITVTDYIKDKDAEGKNVIIITQEAAVYMTPLNKWNGAFDLVLQGNLGKEGEEGIIKKVDELENTQILISISSRFWQESEKLIDHVKKTYNKLGTIDKFEIYEK